MANKKITELTDLPSPAGADIMAIVDDVAGTPTTKKVTATNLMTLAPVQSVAGQTGTVTLSNTDISGLGTAATSASTDFSPAFFTIVSETTTARTLSNSDNAIVLITHYQRLLNYIEPDFVHVLSNGKIVETGGKELALKLESKGYGWLTSA